MRWSTISWRKSSGSRSAGSSTGRLLLQGVHPDHLDACRTLELVHRRETGIWIQQGLSGLVVVTAFHDDLLTTRHLLAPLFDECAHDRRLAFGRRNIVALPPVGAKARLECNGDRIRTDPQLLVGMGSVNIRYPCTRPALSRRSERITGCPSTTIALLRATPSGSRAARAIYSSSSSYRNQISLRPEDSARHRSNCPKLSMRSPGGPPLVPHAGSTNSSSGSSLTGVPSCTSQILGNGCWPHTAFVPEPTRIQSEPRRYAD